MTSQPVGPPTATDSRPAADVTHSARRWWALLAIAASVLVVGLDLTVLNLALPSMAVSLHASTADLQWIVDAYSLVLAALILPAGLLGDRYGRKRLLFIALVLFGASSLACAYATSVGELIAARAVLGVGAAAIFPLALSVLPVLFDGPDRQRAVAAIGGASMLSFPIGPIVGGYLLDHFWWGSVFLINVPVVLLALVAVAFLLPESRSAARPGIDVTGLVVSTAGLVALTYGFIKAGQDGWGDVTAVVLIAAGVAGLALLPLVEGRVARLGGYPLADLHLFRSADFRWGTILATLISFAMFGLFFALPQYFQDVRGANALGSGLRLLPLVGGMLVGMVGGTRLATPRRARDGKPAARPAAAGPRTIVTAGYLLVAVAMGLGALTTLGSSTAYTLAWVAIAGLGLGLVLPAAMGIALGALSAERSGAGSALLTAMRQVGSTIGVAILGTVISNSYSSGVASAAAGLPAQAAAAVRSSVGGGAAAAGKLGSSPLLDTVRSAFVHGMNLMLWTCCGIAVGCALLAVTFLRTRPGGRRRLGHFWFRSWFALGQVRGRIKVVTDIIAQASLRERKKARTRASLREHALRLFREQGYQATTVEQIAAAAEVSPSTFFRYFPTKEDVVLQDDMDIRMMEAFARQPRELTPIAAVRGAMLETWKSFSPAEWEQLREGGRLSMEVPEIRARSMSEFARLIDAFAEAIAGRTGRRPDDLPVRVLAGAVIGVMMSIFLPEQLQEGVAPDFSSPKFGPESAARIDEALALLEEGLPL